jgi:hypothetical protein
MPLTSVTRYRLQFELGDFESPVTSAFILVQRRPRHVRGNRRCCRSSMTMRARISAARRSSEICESRSSDQPETLGALPFARGFANLWNSSPVM